LTSRAVGAVRERRAASGVAFILWFGAVLQRVFVHGKTAPADARERPDASSPTCAGVSFHAGILNVF
jgi:hypothetical protein